MNDPDYEADADYEVDDGWYNEYVPFFSQEFFLTKWDIQRCPQMGRRTDGSIRPHVLERHIGLPDISRTIDSSHVSTAIVTSPVLNVIPTISPVSICDPFVLPAKYLRDPKDGDEPVKDLECLCNFCEDKIKPNYARESAVWLLDSGASFNCTQHISNFIELEEGEFGSVRTANDKLIGITGRGKVLFQHSVDGVTRTTPLYPVYYISSLSTRIISPGALWLQGMKSESNLK